MIGHFFTTVLYQPLFNFLFLLYEYIPGRDFGIAIIVLTILIKFILYPLGQKAIKSQKALSDIQPKIKEIQERLKDNKEKQMKETLEVYKVAKINPFSGFLPLLIQLPILIALYRVFWKGFETSQLSFLYPFVNSPGSVNPYFLGSIDLSHSYFVQTGDIKSYLWPNIILIIIVGILQFVQMKMIVPKSKSSSMGKQNKAGDISGAMQKQMLYFFPFFTALFLLNLPAAIGLYWAVSTIFTIVQQYIIYKKKDDRLLVKA
jgi:YidC/Oxa1 family membrane protein insertase